MNAHQRRKKKRVLEQWHEYIRRRMAVEMEATLSMPSMLDMLQPKARGE